MVPSINVILGLAFLSLAASLATVNGIVLVALLKNKEFHSPTYRIMKNMLLGALFQLYAHLAGGVMTLTDSIVTYYFDKIAGAFMMLGWFLYLCSSLTLAVDRTMTFIRVFSNRTAAVISLCFMSFAWLISIGYFVLMLLPAFSFTYESEIGYFNWYYSGEPGSRFLAELEMYLDFTIAISVFILYIVIFVRLLTMRKQASSNHLPSNIEMRILSVAAVSFLYEMANLVWLFWGMALLDINVFSCSMMTFLMMLNCGLFATVTLIMNGSVRNSVFCVLRIAKEQSSKTKTIRVTVTASVQTKTTR